RRLGRDFRNAPARAEGVAYAHRSEEAGGVLEICEGRAREMRPHHATHDRTRHDTVENAASVPRISGKGLVHVQGMEVGDQSRAQDQVAFRHRQAGGELLADLNLLEEPAPLHARARGRTTVVGGARKLAARMRRSSESPAWMNTSPEYTGATRPTSG